MGGGTGGEDLPLFFPIDLQQIEILRTNVTLSSASTSQMSQDLSAAHKPREVYSANLSQMLRKKKFLNSSSWFKN